jgi:hypothetical protein
MKILNSVEQVLFDRPPLLSSAERKRAFDLPSTVWSLADGIRYRLKASNAASSISTMIGTSPCRMWTSDNRGWRLICRKCRDSGGVAR